MPERDRHDDRPAGARGDDPVRDDLEARGDADFDVGRIAPDETVQGARAGEARLEGVPGVGTLQVVRDAEGRILHVEGTWRAHAEDVDAGPIEAAVAAERALRYEGRLDDPSQPDRDHCDLEVVVTSRSEYRWDAREEDDGRTLPLYNFRPRETGALER